MTTGREGKVVFVLWSGGMDSTYLLEHLMADPSYEEVLAGTVYVGNNEAKAASELAAIEAMLPLFRRHEKFVWLGTVMQIAFTKTNPNLAFKQMPIWLLALLEAVHPPVDEVAIGYHKSVDPTEEDASTHLADLARIWADYRPLLHRDAPRLVFPIAHLTKQEIAARIDPALAAACVWCEAPLLVDGVAKACGNCRTCGARREAGLPVV